MRDTSQTAARDRVKLFELVVAVGLIFPAFFQLGRGIYRSPDSILYDSGGSVMEVPLPFAMVAVFLGLLLLAGRYRNATRSLGLVAVLAFGMALTTLVTAATADFSSESRKLILLLQFLIPTAGLVLGHLYREERDTAELCAKAFLAVITVIVPIQMGISLHRQLIWHDLWLFSIYQHRQFVPVVFIGAYLFAVFVLMDSRPLVRWALVLAPVMGAYAAASYAVLALAFLVGGPSVLVLARPRSVASRLCLVLALAGAAAFLYHDREGTSFQAKYGTFRSRAPAAESALSTPSVEQPPESTASRVPLNVRPRLADWSLYGRGIVESPRTILFGHAKPFDRAVSTSAHNYYLDFVYNFGLLAFLPLLWLIAHTAILLWRRRHELRHDLPLLGLAMVVGFLVLIDNNFKVTFRQPYPGLFGFFVWGLLLSRLTAAARRR